MLFKLNREENFARLCFSKKLLSRFTEILCVHKILTSKWFLIDNACALVDHISRTVYTKSVCGIPNVGCAYSELQCYVTTDSF